MLRASRRAPFALVAGGFVVSWAPSVGSKAARTGSQGLACRALLRPGAQLADEETQGPQLGWAAAERGEARREEFLTRSGAPRERLV